MFDEIMRERAQKYVAGLGVYGQTYKQARARKMVWEAICLDPSPTISRFEVPFSDREWSGD